MVLNNEQYIDKLQTNAYMKNISLVLNRKYISKLLLWKYSFHCMLHKKKGRNKKKHGYFSNSDEQKHIINNKSY